MEHSVLRMAQNGTKINIQHTGIINICLVMDQNLDQVETEQMVMLSVPSGGRHEKLSSEDYYTHSKHSLRWRVDQQTDPDASRVKGWVNWCVWWSRG